MKRTPFYGNRGFSLVELIIVMAMFVIIIAVTGDTFSRIMSRSSTQSRSAASNIEGIVGLEMMRKDLTSTGFGLPWSFSGTVTYSEVDPGETLAATFNGASNEVPVGVSGGNDVDPDNPNVLITGSDYLVVRATSLGTSTAAQRWSFMNYTGQTKPATMTPVSWTQENLNPDDWVVVLKVDLTGTFTKQLVTSGTAYSTQYGNLSTTTGFHPDESKVNHYIYGIGTTSPRMPFNRADYFVRIPAESEENRLPQRCAPNTGILFKGLVNHSDGTLTQLPLLDCVADMQVVYILSSPSSGQITETNSLIGLSGEDIREQLKTIQVYVLTHEGGRDPLYTYPNGTIAVGPTTDGLTSTLGRTFTIPSGGTNYRWKIYRMSVNPLNLGASF